jgi:4-amino-4-deoxy-L-arabinose transferase-like glycosyltransferase
VAHSVAGGPGDPPLRRTRRLTAAAGVFIGAFAYRFIGLDFTNDDLLFFAIGRQIAAFGEWPVRDLFEEGDPLHNVASAVLQSITGHSLVGEALFDILMLSLAAALVTLVTARWLRSAALGAVVGILTVIAWPRLYDYPKALIPAVGLWLCAWYQQRPGRTLETVMGVTVGLSFLLRHDFGVYLAATVAAAIVITRWSRGTPLVAPLLVSGAVAAALILPYLVYVQAHVGIVRYLQSAQRFTAREVSRSDDRPPAFSIDWQRPLWERDSAVPVKVRWASSVDPPARVDAERRYSLTKGTVDDGRTWSYLLEDSSPANVFALVRDERIEDTANLDRSIAREVTPPEPSRLRRLIDAHLAVAPGVLTRQNAVAWLYSVFRWVPWLAAIGVVTLLWRRSVPPVLDVLPPLTLCLLSAPLLLRGNLYENSRLADFTTPAAMLAAALAAMVWRVQPGRVARLLRITLVIAVSISTLAVSAFGQLPRRATAILTLVDEHRLSEESSRLWQGLMGVPPPLDWIPREGGVRGAVEYLRECTNPPDRILVFGFYPDVLYFSGRGAATDRVVLLRGFGIDADEERATVSAITKHPAVVAIVETNSGSGSLAGRVLDGLHPLLENYLMTNYRRSATTSFGGSTGARFDVWVNVAERSDGTAGAMWCRSK